MILYFSVVLLLFGRLLRSNTYYSEYYNGYSFLDNFIVTPGGVETYVLEDRGYFCKEKFMKHLPKILSISALAVLLAFMFILYA